MYKKIKKITLAVTILSLISPSMVFSVKDINPYIDTGSKLEINVNKERVKIDKNLPKVTLQKWGGKVSVDVAYSKNKVNGKSQRKSFTKKVEYNVDSKETVVMDPTDDNTGFNIDINLDSKPTSNFFRYTISGWQNYDFLYQHLTQADKDSGIYPIRDDIEGSYAVYSKIYKNHIEGQINYETGKLFHIYRPKAIDANGNTVWADLNITSGIMTVTVPQSFLDNAIYPVLVDPTFGYTSVGGNCGGGDNQLAGGLYTLSDNASVSKMSVAWFVGASSNGVAGIYNSGLSTLYGTTNVATNSTSFSFFDLTFASPVSLSPATYFLAISMSMPSGTCLLIDVNTGSTNQWKYQNFTYTGSLPSSITPDAQADHRPSIYATYTVPVNTEKKTIVKGIKLVIKGIQTIVHFR